MAAVRDVAEPVPQEGLPRRGGKSPRQAVAHYKILDADLDKTIKFANRLEVLDRAPKRKSDAAESSRPKVVQKTTEVAVEEASPQSFKLNWSVTEDDSLSNPKVAYEISKGIILPRDHELIRGTSTRVLGSEGTQLALKAANHMVALYDRAKELIRWLDERDAIIAEKDKQIEAISKSSSDLEQRNTSISAENEKLKAQIEEMKLQGVENEKLKDQIVVLKDELDRAELDKMKMAEEHKFDMRLALEAARARCVEEYKLSEHFIAERDTHALTFVPLGFEEALRQVVLKHPDLDLTGVEWDPNATDGTDQTVEDPVAPFNIDQDPRADL